ncbi:hypothetical protein CHH58_05140 [Terribacillus saccharophilus]|uniref:hypothetical protein n=1 Tax=Terribacillus saccharophilus TaxID=361277 RepID=UPI000BA6E4E4|nr:hypothetical protein [Terribacillus saccharophilus]PAF38810.1 hypothetical protein CHH58_05140 [Terribacillus saccharophilus]
MRLAYSKVKPGRVTAEEVDNNPHLREHLKCLYCPIKVTFNRSHERSAGKEKVFVRATFKKDKGKEHEECRYNAKYQMDILARESDNNVFKSLENNQFEFRLNMMHNEINLIKNNPTDIKFSPTERPVKQNYVSTGRLDSYLSTMNKIIELRNELADDHEDLTSIVKIKYKDKKISWNNFYYDRNRYSEAFNYLSQNKVPICIEGTVHSIGPSRYDYAIKLVHGKWIKEDGKNLVPTVTVYFKESLKDKFNVKEGDHVAISTIFKTSKGEVGDKAYLNIVGNLHTIGQLHVFKEEDQ